MYRYHLYHYRYEFCTFWNSNNLSNVVSNYDATLSMQKFFIWLFLMILINLQKIWSQVLEWACCLVTKVSCSMIICYLLASLFPLHLQILPAKSILYLNVIHYVQRHLTWYIPLKKHSSSKTHLIITNKQVKLVLYLLIVLRCTVWWKQLKTIEKSQDHPGTDKLTLHFS